MLNHVVEMTISEELTAASIIRVINNIPEILG
jgi:hypothetical protein